MAIGAVRDSVTGYPIQYAKVQPPPLRAETLARDRLLDWLHAKIHSRVILILADAGYGKTTLLADFARRTRLRTLWYRLDDDDLDWTSIVHHLVAAGREHDPSFAPATQSMLTETSLSGPSREAVMDVFLRELPTIAPAGAVLILDDFHLVDEAPDMQFIVRELIARAPERLSIIFASRRGPSIALARLRSNGEVAELGTDDLRFDASETASLFQETYGRTLEPDVLAEVTKRTEGWAASLQLVQAALRDRSPSDIRRFVRSLSGADHELYDYLAEEVVGDLPGDLQTFLMQTAILQVVTQRLASVATGLAEPAASALISSAERLTLLSRGAGGPKAPLRYHPLVREFLESRLTREFGDGAIRDLHRRVAEYAANVDWRTAAHHYWMAGDRAKAHQVIDVAAQEIVAKGEYSLTEPYLADSSDDPGLASFEVLRSRRDFKRGDIPGALTHAQRAVEVEPQLSIALVNLASLTFNVGDFDVASELSRMLARSTTDDGIKGIAEALVALIDSSLDGNVPDLVALLQSLIRTQHEAGGTHFEGIGYLNLANGLRALGDIPGMLSAASASLDLLTASSAGSEVGSAYTHRAWALAQIYGVESAEEEMVLALRETNEAIRIDTLTEFGDIETWFGSSARAADYLAELEGMGDRAGWARTQIDATRAFHYLRIGRREQAKVLLEGLSLTAPCSSTAHKARLLTTQAHLLVASQSDGARPAIAEAIHQSRGQGAGLWLNYCQMLESVSASPEELRRFIRQADQDGMAAISMAAELLTPRLGDLSDVELKVVATEAVRRSVRWREPLRLAVDEGGRARLAASHLLEAVGTEEDVPRLRAVAKSMRGTPESMLGRALARRLAPRVFVEDQGRVSISIGQRPVEGSSIRRKVLGLLCFLVSRPRFSAARDEVLDALWPDFDPSDALNSLNQTVYFLRRVFEPAFQEDLSPGYLNHEGDVVWLDSDLVQSRSQECWDLIRALPIEPTPAEVAMLSETYRAPFALDFAYEEWATAFRSSLLSSYLQVIEKSIRSDTETGQFGRGIVVARRALEVCPEADNIELSLLRLYKLSGSHAAAAEQYAHYSTWLRESLGVEPPSLDSL